MVSELLGSFGDNELSPECIDGAQKLIKKGGISIPHKYSAYVAPISSTSLYSNAVAFGESKMMETPFVVKFRDAFVFDDPQKMWEFHHPNEEPMHPIGHPDFNSHNSRFSKASFIVQDDIMMVHFISVFLILQHGMAAYFDSQLYKDISISIHPDTHSKDMTSWFPMYFPIKQPLFLVKGSKLNLYIWRLTTTRKVWYEWAYSFTMNEIEVMSEISNKNGDSYWIGL